MQRTCFALAMLLGWMASSVLVVGKTSQARVESVAWLPGPGSVCGLAAGSSNPSVVLGQSVDDDVWSEEIGSADQVASDSVQQRDEGESLAVSNVVDSNSYSQEPNGSWGVLGTGYDGAYDFAMHEGQYIENGPSQRDIDHWLSIATDCADGVDETYTVSGPTSSIACEDLDSLFASQDELSQTSSQFYPWLGLDLTQNQDASSDNEVTAPPVVTDTGWLMGKLQGTHDWTRNQLRPWWNATSESAWMTELRDQWTKYQAELQSTDSSTRETFVAETLGENENATEVHEGQPVTTPVVPEDYQEEVLLITAAETLDQIGLRFQEAAQYLRYWAADRVVTKGGSRRVARSLDNAASNSHE